MPAPIKQRRLRPSSSEAGPSRPYFKPSEQRDPSGLPGISKIKASIRQTKRMLAKDTMEPGLKIATQRRLASLEADLAKAERREVEKKNGGKYHMVKFFERQKLLRIIKRLRKTSTDETASSSKREKAERDLEEARVMLNYVLHYPNDKKYISIFPASSDPSASSDSTEGKLTLPPLLTPTADTPSFDTMGKSDKTRLEMLLATRGMMLRRELPQVPEEGLGDGKERTKERIVIPSIPSDTADGGAEVKRETPKEGGATRREGEEGKRKKAKREKKSQYTLGAPPPRSSKAPKAETDKADDFFESD